LSRQLYLQRQRTERQRQEELFKVYVDDDYAARWRANEARLAADRARVAEMIRVR